MGFWQESDAISGKEGRAYIIIDGRREEMFYAKNVEAVADKKKKEYEVIGKRATQHKAAGWSGSGTLTIYYVTSLFRQLMLNYIKGGRDVYFELMVVNDDNNSRAGSQTVILKQCNINKTILAKMDAEVEALEEPIEFTFSDVDMPKRFNNFM